MEFRGLSWFLLWRVPRALKGPSDTRQLQPSVRSTAVVALFAEIFEVGSRGLLADVRLCYGEEIAPGTRILFYALRQIQRTP
jgi:hypothetical protein